MYQRRWLIKYVEENLRMDWESLKNIRFRDLFFINHRFLASLSVCLFILSICEIEQSGNFLCWTFSISHTSCVQLLQNWNHTLPDNRCYLKEYIAQRIESCISDLRVSGLNQLVIFIRLQKCIFVSGIRTPVLNICLIRCTSETGDAARGAIRYCRLLQLPN